jgi:hypothetical protein
MVRLKNIADACRSALAILGMISISGCATAFHVQGYQSRDPVTAADDVKRWPTNSLTTGWDLSYVGVKDENFSAWCDSRGNWGFSSDITAGGNQLVATTQMEFGHIDNRDFRTFQPLAVHASASTKIRANQSGHTTAKGSADQTIAVNFGQINAIRPSVVFYATGGLPIIVWQNQFLTATPGQSYQ